MAVVMNLIWICLVSLAAAGTFRPDLGKPAPIEVLSANAGISGVTYQFYLENDSSVEAGNYLMIVFPSQYTDIGLTSPCQINGVDITCTKIGTNYVRFTLVTKLAALTRMMIRVPGITNPSTPGGTGFFKILTQFAVGSQVIDYNDRFGAVGISATPTTATVTVSRATGGSEKVGGSFALVVSFTVPTAIEAGSVLRLKVPSEFVLSSSFTCTAVANGSSAAIVGPFTCSYISVSKEIIISGLKNALASGYASSISISSFTNTAYILSAGASTYKLDILKNGTSILIATGSANSMAVTAGSIENVVHEPYFTGAQLTELNILYTKLTFSVTNAVPQGGTIVIDYGLDLDIDSTLGIGCWAMSGINPKTDGTQPICTATDGTSSLTLSSFGAIAAGSKVVIVNRVELTSASLTNVSIETKDSSARTIDKDNGSQGGFSIVAKPTITSASVTFPTTNDAGGLSDIWITFKPNADLAPGATIRVYMPRGFVLPSNTEARCTQSAVGGTADLALSTCSLTGYTLTMASLTDTITAADGVTFKLKSNGTTSGWSLPSQPYAIDNPYEWQVEVTSSGSSSFTCFGSLVNVVSEIPFDTTTGNTSIVPEIESPNLYTPYSFVIKIDKALTTTAVMIPVIQISFGTRNIADTSNAFPLDLGTGLTSSGSIPCKISSGLSSYSASMPLACTLTPAASASSTNMVTLTISSFKDIVAGTLLKFKIFIKNSQTASVSDIPITITTLTKTYNSIVTVLQTSTLSIETQAVTSGTFTTKTITSRTSKLISTDTNIYMSVRLSTVASSIDGDKLVIRFPAGWVMNEAQTFKVNDKVSYNTEVYNNAYAPTIIGKLSTAAMINGSSGTDCKIFLENLTNLSYGNMGAGAISLGFVDATTAPTSQVYVDIADTTTSLEATEGANFVVTIEANSLSRLAGDVTYTFVVTTAYNIPAGGLIRVVFPAGYDPTYSTCKTTSVVKNLSAISPKACSVNAAGLTATVSSFAALPKKSTFRVVVYTLKNPDVATTSSFKVYTTYDSDTSHILEKQETGLTLALTAQLNPSSVSVSKYTMFPTSTNSVADLTIEFTLDSNVPYAGVLTVTLPGEFALPTLSSSNCVMNFMYSSCSNSGSVITLVPMMYFPAGYKLMLHIPGVVVPSSDVKNNPISFKATWNGLTILQNPTTVPTSFYFTPTAASTTQITAAVKVWPKNAAELSTTEFTFKLTTAFTPDKAIVIWFPSEFPALGRVQCWSSKSISPTTGLMCKSNPNNSIVISGFSSIAADSEFKVTIRGSFNPSTAGTSSSFRFVTLNPTDLSVIDYLYTGVTTDTLAPPGLLEVYNVTATSYTTSTNSDYTFVTKTTNSVPSDTGEVWLTLSDYDFDTEVFGINAKYNCTAETYESAAFKSVYSDYNCTDIYHNLVTLSGKHTQVTGDTYFRTTFKGIKNPKSSGRLQPFTLSTYERSNLRVLDKTYSTAAAKNIVELIDNKLNIYVDNFQGNLTVRPSVGRAFTIFTESTSLPFKQTMTLTPMLMPNTTNITFTPDVVQLVKGQSRATFGINVAANTVLADYLIIWKLSGDTGNFYAEPANTVLKVDNSFKHTITLDTIPTILVNTSVPIHIYLPVAPLNGLTVNLTAAVGVTAPPVVFSPGQIHGTFNMTVGDVTFTNSRLNITLLGPDAAAFTMKSFSVFYYITKYDDEPPYLDSFVVNNPRTRLGLDVTIQTTEACYFYYLFGSRGLDRPANDTLMINALNKKSTATETYGVVYVGGSFMSKLSFKGLKEESNYVLYGYLQDTFMREINGVFDILMETAEMEDTISFQLRFTGTQPTDGQLNGDILNVLRQQFGVITSSLLTYVSKARMLQTSTSATYTFMLEEEETIEAVSPIQAVKYQADVNKLAQSFASYNLTLDQTFNIANSIKVVENKRPQWIVYPYVVGTPSSSNATVSCSADSEGIIYMQVLADNDDLPSSSQVADGLDPFNRKANMTYSQPTTYNETLTFFIDGLNPTYSYTVLMTVRNNHPKKPRVMREEVMANFNVITGAKLLTMDDDSTAVVLAMGAAWLLFGWV